MRASTSDSMEAGQEQGKDSARLCSAGARQGTVRQGRDNRSSAKEGTKETKKGKRRRSARECRDVRSE